MCGGGGEAPGPATPSAEERRLMELQETSSSEQLRLARRQQRESDALMPLMLEEYGLTRYEDVSEADPRRAQLIAERDSLRGLRDAPDGTGRGRGYQRSINRINRELPTLDKGGKKTIRYEKTANAETDKRKEIEGLQLDRSLKALKGELPVTVTLTRELELGKRALAEKLSKQLGSGWELSSPGIQANAEYDRMATSLKEAEQHDQLTTAEALSINRQNSRAGNTQGTYQTMSTPYLTSAQLMSSAGSGARSALDYYGTLRNASLRGREMAGQERAGYVGAGVGAIGIGVGAALAI